MGSEQVIFGKFLVRQRKERGWSQYDLADESGIPRNTIASIEIGRAIPKTDILLKLADVFHISEQEVFNAAGYAKETKGTYVAQETPQQILDRIKLDIRRLEKLLEKKEGE